MISLAYSVTLFEGSVLAAGPTQEIFSAPIARSFWIFHTLSFMTRMPFRECLTNPSSLWKDILLMYTFSVDESHPGNF